jgi:hypothetical protein
MMIRPGGFIPDSASRALLHTEKLKNVAQVLALVGMASLISLSAAAASLPTKRALNRVSPELPMVNLVQLNRPGSMKGRVEADFDGDGVLDCAELSGAPLEITVRLSGAPMRHVPLLQPALGLAVVDLDHDGDRDLVAVSGQPNVLVWWNDGSGAFEPKSNSVIGLLTPEGRIAPDPPNLSSVPMLQVIGPSGGETAQSCAAPSMAAPRAVGRAYDLASPRGPPASLSRTS